MRQHPIDIIELSGDHTGITVGGKVAGLAQLARAGLPVPPAVVIPAEAGEDEIEWLAGRVAHRFTGSTLAVRSSGVAEDLRSASFAGQYETVLGVPAQRASIAAAIRTVRASATSAHVDAYAAGHSTSMAVLVMPMIEAKAAGLAFTRDPVSGENRVVIEAVAGLADRLAAGEQEGERWVIDASPRAVNDLGVLTEAVASEVAGLARRCEDIAGSPQDVEWAHDGTRILLLQSRAITTLDVEPIPMDDPVPPGPWGWDSTHSRIPMTPLTASMFAPGFEAGSRRLVEHYGMPFDRLVMRSINGYAHIQVVPPIGRAGSSPPPPAVMRLLFRLIPALRRREKTARRALSERTDRRLVDEWHRVVRPRVESDLRSWFDVDLASLTDEELSVELERAVDTQRDVFGWNMVTDPFYLLPMSELHDFVMRAGLGDIETVTRLLAGAARSECRDALRQLHERVTPDVEAVIERGSPSILADLRRADADFASAYEDHLWSHGQRILGFDLAEATVAESPFVELRRVVSIPDGADPTPAAEALADELRSVLDQAEVGELDRRLSEARTTYYIREEGESVHARAFGAVRTLALEAGRRMMAAGYVSDPDHVFYLEGDEVRSWLAHPGDHDLSERIRVRRGQRRWALSHPPAAGFIGGEVLPPGPESFLPGVARMVKALLLVLAHDSRPADLADGADGVAASPGVHTGPARIVERAADLDRVRPGDVLIAPITSSPWEVVFPYVGAMVTEGGGILSHPAIVAREYGLPAVVGCEGATSRFSDGELVTVDGTNGTVRAVDEM